VVHKRQQKGRVNRNYPVIFHTGRDPIPVVQLRPVTANESKGRLLDALATGIAVRSVSLLKAALLYECQNAHLLLLTYKYPYSRLLFQMSSCVQAHNCTRAGKDCLS
jgi:hypothetical protein